MRVAVIALLLLAFCSCKTSRKSETYTRQDVQFRDSSVWTKVSNTTVLSATSVVMEEEVVEYDTSLPVDSITKLPPVLRHTKRTSRSVSEGGVTSSSEEIRLAVSSVDSSKVATSVASYQSDGRSVSWVLILGLVLIIVVFFVIIRIRV